MLQLSDNIVYWEEYIDGVKRLAYGFINPDINEPSEKELFVNTQAKYLSGITNLEQYRKVHLFEQNMLLYPHIINHGGEVLFEYEYEQDLVKPYRINSQKSISHITITEIKTNDPHEIAVFNGVLLLVPNSCNIVKFADYLMSQCKKFKFETFNSFEYDNLFREIIKEYLGCIIISDLGECVDARKFKNDAISVASICTQNVYK